MGPAAALEAAAAAAAAAGEFDFEYTALLEALLEDDDHMPLLGSGATSTNRPPCQYQLVPNSQLEPNHSDDDDEDDDDDNMRASLLSLFFAGAAFALPKITRTGKYLYDEAGSRFFIKVCHSLPPQRSYSCSPHLGYRVPEGGYARPRCRGGLPRAYQLCRTCPTTSSSWLCSPHPTGWVGIYTSPLGCP